MKQYLLMVNEDFLKTFASLFKGVDFIPVEGMDITDNKSYKILVTPNMQSADVVPPVVEPVIENG